MHFSGITSRKATVLRWFISLILILSLFPGCDKPQPTAEDSQEIDTSQDPVQIPYTPDNPIIIKFENGEFTIKPVAKYKASVMAARKKSYSGGWQGKIAPIDLALVWGKLAEPGYDKYVTYSQSDRWYFFEYEKGSPFDAPYVYFHSSNNHIIPSNDNVYKAIKTIKKKQKIILEGFLVNLTGIYEGQKVWWKSSLSRKDSSDGSCELFYVEKIRVGNEVYE